ncbi:MAG: HAD family hydrolase [Spirochaetae bacterium HGW-Spirochaetae-1]|jgi:phosphoglycolate phosphatase|nr:MAG: HAD family hydrolase [Spirochaetae bacterium HGW-Spirochaetae-1]
MKPCAVIFDLDGTLINSLGDIADTMNHILAINNLPVHEEDQYRYFIGDGLQNLIIRSLPEDYRSDKFVSEMHRAYGVEYRKRCLFKTRPYPGIVTMLETLSMKGIKMAVLSNKSDEFTRYMVSELFPDNFFSAVMGSRNDTPRKPDPAGALMLAKQCEIEPACCLFIGDSNIDMRTGTNAGMLPVGVLWGFRTEQELRDGGAGSIVTHPGEIMSFFP